MLDAEVAAGFFLQQSIEKYLKAYLLVQGWKLKKLHDLEVLLEDASSFDQSLAEFSDLCEQITGFYLAERYTSIGDTDSEIGEIRDLLTESRRFIVRLFSDECLNLHGKD